MKSLHRRIFSPVFTNQTTARQGSLLEGTRTEALGFVRGSVEVGGKKRKKWVDVEYMHERDSGMG